MAISKNNWKNAYFSVDSTQMKNLRSYSLLLAGLLQLAPLWRTAVSGLLPTGGPLIAVIRALVLFGGVVGSVDAVSGATGVVIPAQTLQAKVNVKVNFTVDMQNPGGYTVNSVSWQPVTPPGVLPPGLALKPIDLFGDGSILIPAIVGTPTNSGTYVVKITVKDTFSRPPYTTSGNVTIVIAPADVPATITTQPSNVTVTEGGSASFTVVGQGTPPLTYQWYVGAKAINGATSPTLALNPVALTDAGNYTVAVSNKFGGQTSGIAVLTVNPKVIVPPFSLGAPTISGGQIHFALPTVAGASYAVEFLAALKGATWQVVNQLPVQSGPGPVTMDAPATLGQGWYRVVSNP